MSENTTMEQLFQRAYFFITEGNTENALAVLDSVQAESVEQKREEAYLRAWCHMLRGHWDEAARFLLSAEVSGEAISDILSLGQTERRRRSYYILVLGDVAVNLWRYDEAARHYTQCIKFLDERRMNDANLRIRALLGLGLTQMMTGYYSSALKYYEEALRVCGDDSRKARLPDIYYGLCDAHRHLGNFDCALEYGKKALELYTERSEKQLMGQMRNILGRVYYQVGDFQASGAYYTEALALAMSAKSDTMILNNFTALADLRLQEEKPEEAWRYCEMALDYRENVSGPYYVGMMYMVCGKVAEALAKGAEEQEAREQRKRAISYYEKAVETLKPTEARSELAEAYGLLAQILEASGQQDLAFTYWRSAYATRSGGDDSSWA